MTVIFREADEADMNGLDILLKESNRISVSAKSLLQSNDHEKATIMIAVNQEQIIGFVEIELRGISRQMAQLREYRAYIHNLFVQDQFGHENLRQQLYMESLKWAKVRGARTFESNIPPHED